MRNAILGNDLNFANLEHEYFASNNFRDFVKNDKFRAFNFAKIDKRQT